MRDNILQWKKISCPGRPVLYILSQIILDFRKNQPLDIIDILGRFEGKKRKKKAAASN